MTMDTRERIARYLNGLEPGGTWENFTGEAEDILAIVMDTIGFERDVAIDALRTIAKGEGPFSVDHHQFAKNVIEAMKKTAHAALEKLEK